MLRYLQIRDFAIIDSVELEFSGGLTVLTGETGAGNPSSSMRSSCWPVAVRWRCRTHRGRAGRAVATIDVSGTGGELRHLLDEHSIAHEGSVVLRRVIGSDGRSRAGSAASR